MDTSQKPIPLAAKRASVVVAGIYQTSCPYLGSTYDRVTSMAFPDSANRCCRHQAQLERQLQFQRAFCLSDSYQECSIFQQEGDPKNSETEAAETAGKSSRLKMALPLIIILITFITFVSLSAMGIDLFATLSAFAPR